MKTTSLNRLILTSLIILVGAIPIHASATESSSLPIYSSIGQIETTFIGKVLDGATGQPLIGATVMIEGSTIGTTTDDVGEFSLRNLQDGSYTIVVRFLGYQQQSVSVTIENGEYERLTINLIPESIDGDEVLVYAQALGQVRAINQQRESDAIVNVVSQEKLRELPDVNAAEAIGRLPGVALQRNNGEGQKVIVRGLEPKFTNITINGVKVPSNSGSNKSVDLSMIPSEALSGIELFKSPTPDMDADAIGGTVNLVLREAPNRNITDVKIDGAYNGLKSDFGNYKSSLNLSRRYLDNKLGLIFQGTVEGINRSSNEFSGGYQILEFITPNEFTLSDQIEFRTRSSANLNLDYRLKNGKLSLYSYYAGTARDIQSRSEIYSPFVENIVRYSINSSERKINLFSNMVSGQHDINRIKIDWSGSYARTKSETPAAYNLLFEDIEAYAHDPSIQPEDPFMTWVDASRTEFSRARLRNGSINQGEQFEDNLTGLINFELPLTTGYLSSKLKIGGKITTMSRELDDQRLAETFYYLGGLEMRTAIEQWEQSNPPLQLTPDGRIALNNFIEEKPFQIGTFLDGDFVMTNPLSKNILKDWLEAQREILNVDRFGFEDNYQFYERVSAGYAMLNIELGDWFKLIPGFRIEDTFNDMTAKYSKLQQRYGNLGTIEDTTQTKSYVEFMPHVHLKLMPTNWFDIRLSYAQTLARPDYNMVIPKANVNVERSTITAGNPNLKHMTADNYDATVTFYSGKFGLFSVSGFYKKLENIFFAVNGLYLTTDSLAAAYGFPTRKGSDLTSYDNSPEATVKGIELDLQTNFSASDSPFLRGIVLNLNLTRQFSETTKYNYTKKDSLVGIVRGRPVFETIVVENRRQIDIPGQTPLMFNMAVGYDYKGFSGRVSGNYQSEYLIGAGQSEVQDVNNGSFWRWDLALKQKINQQLTVNFSISNLTSMREESYRNYELRYPRSISHYGAITNFGIQYRF